METNIIAVGKCRVLDIWVLDIYKVINFKDQILEKIHIVKLKLFRDRELNMRVWRVKDQINYKQVEEKVVNNIQWKENKVFGKDNKVFTNQNLVFIYKKDKEVNFIQWKEIAQSNQVYGNNKVFTNQNEVLV